jgi:arylsulfatase A-like enzyme
MASTMTGQFAYRHGFQNSFQKLADSQVTTAEALRDAGYRTAAVLGSYPVSSIYGLAQGFDSYDEEFTRSLRDGNAEDKTVLNKEKLTALQAETGKVAAQDQDRIAQINLANWIATLGRSRRTDTEVSDRAIATLRQLSQQQPAKPFFLWVHYFGPHAIPDDRIPFEEQLRRDMTGYNDRVRASDAEVGRLFDEIDHLSLTPNTLVILHADHGESLLEHDYFGHGRFLYQDNALVPLILRWPAVVQPGQRSRVLAANVDIFATILDAADVDFPDQPRDGISLIRLLRHEAHPREIMYMETYMPSGSMFAERLPNANGEMLAGVLRYGLLIPPHKLIETVPTRLWDHAPNEASVEAAEATRTIELYDVVADPLEKTNLAEARPSQTAALRDALASIRGQTRSAAPTALVPGKDHEERLRSLGYVQ